MLVWIGHRAFVGWQQSSVLLAERRAEEKAMLLSVALDRDMKAVQASVLARFGGRRLAFRNPYELFDLVSAAFAQFPYADALFVWRPEPGHAEGRLYVFSRVERPPRWAAPRPHASPFPLELSEDPLSLAPVVKAIRATDTGEQFMLGDFQSSGTSYQLAASLFYEIGQDQPLVGAVGFLADLQWVRRFYFGELMKQVESVIGDTGVRFSILDEHGAIVATSGPPIDRTTTFERHFPLAFFDRSLLAAQSKLASTPLWTIRVDSGLAPAEAAPWTPLWWLMAVAAVAALFSVSLVAHSIRVHAEAATMKSDFVATVTHDLKAPLALIKVVGETIGMGRYRTDASIDEYGRLLRAEAMRLTLRIDNLLAYARATDLQQSYRTDTVDLLDVMHEALHRAAPRLADFDIDANLAEAPLVVGDAAALLHVFDNLIDNAIKYSADARRLSIQTRAGGGVAVVTVSDAGIGIAQDDLGRVFEKFFRGKTGRAGSGLGLAIARRVVLAHGGTIAIASELGRGTKVTLTLPLSTSA